VIVTVPVSANQPYVLRIEYPNGRAPERYDNDGRGFDPNAGVTYIELGDVPITIRYADYGRMFEGCLTVIVSYAEQEAIFTVETLDGRLASKPQKLGGDDGADVGIFRVFTLPENQASPPKAKKEEAKVTFEVISDHPFLCNNGECVPLTEQEVNDLRGLNSAQRQTYLYDKVLSRLRNLRGSKKDEPTKQETLLKEWLDNRSPLDFVIQ